MRLGKEAGLLVGLAALALALRLPALQGVPAFGVAWKEVWIAYQIAFQHLRPATDYAKDSGPLFNYLLAEGFRVFGPSLLLPRLVAAVAGALSVPVTYLIGREALDRRTGLLAALMLAFSGVAILLAHQAFSDTLTPLFVSSAALTTLFAERRSPWWLVPAGFLWALALQVDSSVLALLLPLAVYLAWRTPARIPQTIGGCVAFVAGYAHMILLNVREPMVSLHWILQRKGYAVARSHGVPALGGRLLAEIQLWARALATSFPLPHGWAVVEGLGFLASLLWLLGFLAALRQRGAKGRPWLLLALGVGPLFVIPVFNRDYAYPELTRYLVPLLPFAFVLMARSALAWLDRLQKGSRLGAALFLAAMVVVFPAASTATYWGGEGLSRQGNAQLLGVAEGTRVVGLRAAPVYLDATGFRARWLTYMLRSDGMDPHLVGDPWAPGAQAGPSLGAWRRIFQEEPEARVAVVSAASFRRLRAALPAGARVQAVPGPRGAYFVIRMGPRRGP